MKLFQYAVIYDPKKVEGEKQEKAVVIVPITAILAENENSAMLIAARSIPAEYVDKISECEVAIRPF